MQDASGPFRGLRECASASPEDSAAGMAQVNVMSAQPAVSLRSKPGTRTLVKVRYTLADPTCNVLARSGAIGHHDSNRLNTYNAEDSSFVPAAEYMHRVRDSNAVMA